VAVGDVKEGRGYNVPQKQKKEKCPDCEECQVCNESRCRLCRGEHCKRKTSELGSSFTYGEYLAWKNKRTSESNEADATGGSEPMGPAETLKKTPTIDRSECTDCESCISLRPDIFKRNQETGSIEVAELSDYPEDDIEQVMSMCPGDCIAWQ
jgi:ferredoxin